MYKFNDREYGAIPGAWALVGFILAAGALAFLAFVFLQNGEALGGVLVAPLSLSLLAFLKGIRILEPNQSLVLTLFGRYKGTLKEAGLWWVNPFLGGERLSLRTSNYETDKLKVNDNHSNPIEIAAIVVWRVSDSAEALFNVADYRKFLVVQSESALRELASQHPYDQHEAGVLSLRSDSEKIAAVLKAEVQKRLIQAGIEIIEARLSHLAYSPEVAGSMLRLQQATAVIAARQKIVEGAVTMVELALKEIETKQMAVLDPAHRARLVSDLLLVLCGDKEASPVISVGGGARP
jgi:regulator of protease activity HflC (stomatin/prohibitin superfamily)